ncbi:hypothetical protein [Endozoicomonas ascidiicola]|nr:hypothetical protein [Endozoicomonas ascidiicola]
MNHFKKAVTPTECDLQLNAILSSGLLKDDRVSHTGKVLFHFQEA